VSYHTGAGYGDATFLPNATSGINGFLNQTNTTTGTPDGTPLYNQEFDLGNDWPWQLEMAANTNFYAAWQPVRVRAGGGYSDSYISGFFINETGLQWTSTPERPGVRDDGFGGWLGESSFIGVSDSRGRMCLLTKINTQCVLGGTASRNCSSASATTTIVPRQFRAALMSSSCRSTSERRRGRSGSSVIVTRSVAALEEIH
jgi:hypothetical protein